MPIKDPDNVNWTVVVYLFFVTLLGSLSSYCYQFLNGNKFHIWVLVAQIFISIFAGTLVVLAASYFNWDFELAGGIAGLAGWSGAALIKALEERLIRKAKGDG
ncbi:phage holin family protein [Gilliamella sp. B3927]|uniref:phage holin family protein n=2 Tax=Gilliamella TaxID=1193503 RepID=UPI002269D5A8|nr:phage holin family protein [Gilliamella sp. B3927]MCX8633754.1 phage holin family protein [Gilliamella sp. B3927]